MRSRTPRYVVPGNGPVSDLVVLFFTKDRVAQVYWSVSQ